MSVFLSEDPSTAAVQALAEQRRAACRQQSTWPSEIRLSVWTIIRPSFKYDPTPTGVPFAQVSDPIHHRNYNGRFHEILSFPRPHPATVAGDRVKHVVLEVVRLRSQAAIRCGQGCRGEGIHNPMHVFVLPDRLRSAILRCRSSNLRRRWRRLGPVIMMT